MVFAPETELCHFLIEVTVSIHLPLELLLHFRQQHLFPSCLVSHHDIRATRHSLTLPLVITLSLILHLLVVLPLSFQLLFNLSEKYVTRLLCLAFK